MAGYFAKRYPQGEIDEAYPMSFSMSNATSSFPYSQAFALWSSYLGRCPKPAMDLNRLNTNSTCQRTRYHSRMSVSVKEDAGNVENSIMYFAYSSVWS